MRKLNKFVTIKDGNFTRTGRYFWPVQGPRGRVKWTGRTGQTLCCKQAIKECQFVLHNQGHRFQHQKPFLIILGQEYRRERWDLSLILGEMYQCSAMFDKYIVCCVRDFKAVNLTATECQWKDWVILHSLLILSIAGVCVVFNLE